MKIPKEARKVSRELFRRSITDGRLDSSKISTFAQKLIEAKPRHYVNILKDFQRLIRLEVARRHAIVETAGELDQAGREGLEATLRAKYGADLTTEFKVTPSLIGGLRVKIGSDVFDSSVRERLSRLESSLATA